jgi:hypothetical protein
MEDSRTERQVMIDVLKTATDHSENPHLQARRTEFSGREYAIVIELLEAKMIDGDYYEGERHACVDGITLKGRLFRDQLISERDAKRWPARLKRAALLFAGWISGMITAYAKVLIEHFTK